MNDYIGSIVQDKTGSSWKVHPYTDYDKYLLQSLHDGMTIVVTYEELIDESRFRIISRRG